MMHVVLDTMIFLQALSNPLGPSGLILARGWEATAYDIVLSQDMLNEIASVLSRPKVRKAFASVSDEQIHEFVRLVEIKCKQCPTVPHVFTFPRDPKDEMVIDLALATNAKVIVSRDNDLLDLMSIDNVDGLRLKQLSNIIEILTPNEFITRYFGFPEA